MLTSGAIISGCAAFDLEEKNFIITALLLLLPIFDKHWSLPCFTLTHTNLAAGLALLAIAAIGNNISESIPDTYSIAIIVLVVALPEEWFFRAYLQKTFEKKKYGALRANIITSSIFAFIHVVSSGLLSITTFIPSLFFGWLYSKSNDFLLTVLIHAISNIIYITLLKSTLLMHQQ